MPVTRFATRILQSLRSQRRRKRSHQLRNAAVESMEPRLLLTLVADLNPDVDANFTGSTSRDRFLAGSGPQQVVAGAGNDRLLSLGDAGEPDPAQTNGADGRVNPPVADGTANDIFYGGLGADVFEFRPLLNATQEVRDQYTSRDRGNVNWRRVAGENDEVHAHWVEGIGDDIVMDFSRGQGDRFEVNGHTATLDSITYGEDEIGTYSLVTIYSEQGNAGAHDDDPLGTFKVYGDKVNKDDITFNAGVFYGMEQLNEADRLAESNGGGKREVIMGADGDSFMASGRVNDRVTAGLGSQNVDLGGGSYDVIYLLGDAGEPDPAQTDGADGRINPPVDPALADDVVTLGQGKDIVEFRPLLNARPDVLAKYTRADGSINWRGVAGENNDVHAHWVEGIGDDIVHNFSLQDGDQLRVSGHTATLDSITYGQDDIGTFSLVTIYSEQGNAGAHDDDPLGTFKVYGDKVTADDVQFNAGVFYGVDQLATAAALDNSELRDQGLFGTPSKFFTEPVRDDTHEADYEGSRFRDHFVIGSGNQTVYALAGNDLIYSLGDAGEPDPAQTEGGAGRVDPPVPDGRANDTLIGGLGADTFEFRPLLNATTEVKDQFRSTHNGLVNWRRVAGENDNVHEHWVEGIGHDRILDYNQAEGDRIKISGHTATLDSITYGQDEIGTFSLITIYSEQGNAGAHDNDPLGTIRVYGDKVTAEDLTINAGVFYGMDALDEANRRADHNANGRRVFASASDNDEYAVMGNVSDYVTLGRGSQNVDTTAGNDTIYVLGDAGEPDPAQTDGDTGRVTPAVDPDLANDVIRAGQGRDTIVFRPLLNAKTEVLQKHLRDNGTINWRGVAGENDDVHNHWVEGIGDDILLDFRLSDGDRIRVEGHTATLGSIEYGEDELGTFSLVTIYSEQGNAGAHDDDPLGTIRVYGDKVTAEDITFKAHVFYGIDMLNTLEGISNEDYIRSRQDNYHDDDDDNSLF